MTRRERSERPGGADARPPGRASDAVGSSRGTAPRTILERETGIEPATNSLEGCDSTTELLPPTRLASAAVSPLRRGKPAAISPLRQGKPAVIPQRLHRAPHQHLWLAIRASVACHPKLSKRAKDGGEGRTRTFEGARPTDLQSAAFDRFATSPMRCVDESALSFACSSRPHPLPPTRGGRRREKLAKGFEPPTG